MTDPTLSTAPLQADGSRAACRTIVAGLGHAGLECAAAIAQHPGCTLAGLVEPRTDLRRFARGAGFRVPLEPGLARVLARAGADVAVICSPRDARAALLEEALGHGLEVIMDGLPAGDEAQLARLATLCDGAGARVGCAVSVLFHPLFRSACRLLDADALGGVRRVRGSVFVSRVFAPAAPPQDSDVLDFAVGELLALLDRCFGSVGVVRATANRLYGSRVDEVHAMLGLANGIDVGVDGSWSVPGYPRAALVVEVEGERGTMIVSDDALEVELHEAVGGFPAGLTRRGIADEADAPRFDAGERGRGIDAFVQAREAGTLLRDFDMARALRVVRVLAAMRRSAGEAGAPCEVSA